MAISVTDPIGQAYNRAVLMAFKPFDIGKWFVLGFVAWLAYMGERGGYNFNSISSRRAPAPIPAPATGPGTLPATMPAADFFETVRSWITLNVVAAIVIGLAIAIVGLAIGLVILWINSRGKFMFLRAIATNTAQVTKPWKEYRELGDSLFAFRACLFGAGMLINVVIVGAAVLIARSDIQARTFGAPAKMALITGITLMLPAMLILGLISWCTNTFVTTIMYAGQIKVIAAWREFRQSVMPGNVGTLVLFLLMQIVLGLAVLIGQVMVGCGTCCVGFLPYIGTVLTLPLILFMRCYSVYFLQQFGPRYQIIQEPPPAMGFPVIGLTYPPTVEPNPPQQPPGI